MSTLKGKHVLVTGADGFIGSHLTERLHREGCKVRAFVYYNSFNNWGWLDSLPTNVISEIEVISSDIRDPHAVLSAMKDIDIVFHLAALIAIPFSYTSPDSYVDTNVKGTLNILQASRTTSPQRVLITSTSEVYGTAQYIPIDEKHPKQGQSPYSATKIAADALAESFYRSFNVPVTIVRPFNTFGPRQSARGVIPATIIQLLDGKKEIQLGSMSPTRDFVYVTDTINGYIEIASNESTIGREINIATGSEISIGELVALLIKKINPAAKMVSDESRIRPKGSEVERLCGSSKIITELTGWKPSVSFEQGLENTIDWFKKKEYHVEYKVDIYNV